MADATLRQVEEQSGAVFSDANSALPAHFGDPAGEYHIARGAAALFDLNDRTQIEITGTDRATFLHNFCTNDIKRLRAGEGCEAFVTSVKGRVLAHIFVFAAPESLWIETVPGSGESLIAHLDRYLITEDVQLHDRTGAVGELFVSGPEAAGSLDRLGMDVGELAPFGHAPVTSLPHPLFVRRVDLLAQPGFLLSAPRVHLADLWSRLTAAGLRPAGHAAFEPLRIEAALPQYGVDITDDQLAQEVARIRQAISFTKGCYLGQEPIARIDALGHVNRELRGLECESGPVPAAGTPVLAADTGAEIGQVTSAAFSDGRQAPVALGYLRRQYTKPGTAVRVGDAVATVFWPEGE